MSREIMPIIGTRESIPFDLLLKFEVQAKRNHCQSLEMLASRGGVSWIELVAIVEGWDLHECNMMRRPWPTEEDAKRRVLASLGAEVKA